MSNFTKAVARYVAIIDGTSPLCPVNRTHLILRDLYDLFGTDRVDSELDRVFAIRAYDAAPISIANWDSFESQPMYVNGKCIGTLMPRMTQAQLDATPGIQGWSRPETETRTVGS